MQRRITIRDIAEASGYHFTTVSMALRGTPGLRQATREDIRRIAVEMGYSPDPMVQALAAYRQLSKPPADHTPLAWLSCASRTENRPDYTFLPYLEGARDQAQRFGYRLEEFLLGKKGMTPKRLQGILYSRGINGILVSPQPEGKLDGAIEMDWSPFAAVTFGYSLVSPALHLVTAHHANAARLVIRKLVALGYRRIGLCIEKIGNKRVSGGWLGGYCGEIMEQENLPWIAPMYCDNESLDDFIAWQRSNRLDSVITLSTMIERVRSSGKLRVPEDLAMVSLGVKPEDDHSGIDQNEREIGATAVDTLIGMLHTNQRGLPRICKRILIEASWRDGATTQQRVARKRSRSAK